MILFPFAIPVDPDAGPARQLLANELSKPEYRAAEPTWFDRASQAFENWLSSLTPSTNGLTQGPVLAIVLVLVVGAIVAAYFVFGPPRLNRRSKVGELFGQDDSRDAAALRRAAEAAAGRGDYTLAIEELFRSIARGLAERTVVTTSPGTTALGFAAAATPVFPTFALRLDRSAQDFDAVRYLGATGTEEQWTRMSVLERELRAARPLLPDLLGTAT